MQNKLIPKLDINYAEYWNIAIFGLSALYLVKSAWQKPCNNLPLKQAWHKFQLHYVFYVTKETYKKILKKYQSDHHLSCCWKTLHLGIHMTKS